MALSIRKVSKSEVPQSNHAGRPRAHNDFDEHMSVYNAADWTDEDGNVEWDGWNAVQASSPEELKKLTTQLTAAGNHAEVGISKRTDEMALTLWFMVKSRVARPRKPKGDGNGVSEGTNARVGTVSHLEPASENTDADSPKRERKAS